MPQGDKSAGTDKQKRQVPDVEQSHEQKAAARPEAEACAWAATNKLQTGGKKFASRRKLPSGPLGGSGRKTNSARSSSAARVWSLA